MKISLKLAFISAFVSLGIFGYWQVARSETQYGWYGKYYNYSAEHPDMELPGEFWLDNKNGDPLGTWKADWYSNQYLKFNQVDSDLRFGYFYPFDGSSEEITSGHDRYFGVHWQAQVATNNPGTYDFKIISDDDAWVYFDGELVVDNSGLHTPIKAIGRVNIKNIHTVDIFFADRHTNKSYMYFTFINSDRLTIVTPQTVLDPNDFGNNNEENNNDNPNQEEDRPFSEIDINSRNFGIVVAAGEGEKPYLKVFDRGGNFKKEFLVFDEAYDGGVNLAVKDLGEDRKVEIVVAPIFGAKPEVKIYSSDGSLINSFMAYPEDFYGGVNVAIGDTNGNATSEIITGSGIGGSQIRVFEFQNGSYQVAAEFSAYNQNYQQGIKVAAGDLDGDGKYEIIAGTEIGGGPHVRVFDGEGNLKFSPGFFAYREELRQGIKVAAGDLDGDGQDEIITGTNQGLGPQVRVFDPFGRIKFTAGFFAYNSTFRGGVNVATADLNLNGRDEIITGAGPGGGPHIRIFGRYGEDRINAGFFAFPEEYRSGVQVGGGILDL